MDSPYVCKLAAERSVLLFGDRVYELSDSLHSKDMMLTIGGVCRSFIPTENLCFFENLQYSAQFLGSLERAMSSVIAEERKVSREFRDLGTSTNTSAILDFIRDFLRSWEYDTRIGVSQESLEYKAVKYSPPSRLHEGAQTRSIFFQKVRKEPVFFFNGMVYELADGGSGRDGFIVGGRMYSLANPVLLSEVRDRYASAAVSYILDRVQSVSREQMRHIEQERQRGKEIAKKLSIIPTREDVGYCHDSIDGNYYIWMHMPSVELWSHIDGGTTFHFPACKAGLKLIKNGDGIDIDRDLESGRVRILRANSMIGGTEYSFDQDLREKEYPFPACTTTDKNPYPHLCIGWRPFSDYVVTERRTLKQCIRSILDHAKISMQKGYHDLVDVPRGHSYIIYDHLDDESKRETFFDYRVTKRDWQLRSGPSSSSFSSGDCASW